MAKRSNRVGARQRPLRPNELAIDPLPLERFTHDQERLRLFADASDFGPCRDGNWWLQPLYNDAIDLGIAISSHHTRVTLRFWLERTEYYEGEIVAWHFKPVDLHLAPSVNGVTIIND